MSINKKRNQPFPGFIFILFILVLALASTGCGQRSGPEPSSLTAGQSITFQDDMGREVTVKPVERIVSLAPSSTEILFAIGVGDKVVGVDDYSNYPAEAAAISKVGAYNDPSVEMIVALKPDLVLAGSIHKTAVHKLEQLDIPVAVAFPRNLEGVLTSIRWIGIAVGARDEAVELEGELQLRLQRIDDKIAALTEQERPWVYYELYSDPIMTCGPNTLSHELIVRAGGRNIAFDAATDYPEFSPEAIVSRNPDIIIFPNLHGTETFQAEAIIGRPGWDTIKAVQNNRLYGIDDDLISRPGPRVVDAVEELVQVFHPGL
ncbi:MAG: cobalamin-binding protein [Firmicutes bacterium]|nr:cobalamin-binding protein [Bacillota bacterium]